MSDTEQSGGANDYSHLFQGERVVSDVELRVDVANSFSRYVAGDEDVELEVDSTQTPVTATFYRGARTRVVGSHQRTTGQDETIHREPHRRNGARRRPSQGPSTRPKPS